MDIIVALVQMFIGAYSVCICIALGMPILLIIVIPAYLLIFICMNGSEL